MVQQHNILQRIMLIISTKYVEVDCQSVCKKIVAKEIQLEYSPSKDQLADLTQAIIKKQQSRVQGGHSK